MVVIGDVWPERVWTDETISARAQTSQIQPSRHSAELTRVDGDVVAICVFVAL